MKESKKTKEKNCIFYASDYHFEIISLPYISKRIDENKKVIILTDNSLEKTINTLIEKTNIKQEKKEKLLELNWKSDDIKKLDEIKDNVENKRNIEVFVKGKKDYIEHINKEIERISSNYEKMSITDCYNIEEVCNNMENIVGKYDRIISTMKK